MKTSPLTVLCDEMNEYINEHGQIPRNTFIQHWHQCDNDFWSLVFADAYNVHEQSLMYEMPNDTRELVDMCLERIDAHGHIHHNILNPSLEDEAGLPGAVKKMTNPKGYTKSTKHYFWQTMMRLREYYCWVNGIDLPNEDSSIGKLNQNKKDVFETMFSKIG